MSLLDSDADHKKKAAVAKTASGAKTAGGAKTAPAGGDKSAPADKSTGWGNSGWAKATGLAPWAKMFGAGQDEGYKPATPVGGSSARDLATGKSGAVSNKVTGEDKKTGFGRDEKGGFKAPEYNNWSATGKTYGNRKDDLDAKAEGKGVKAKAPSVWQPDLSKIGGGAPGSSGYNNTTGVLSKDDAASQIDKSGGTQGYSDGGSFRSSKGGSYSGWSGPGKASVNQSGEGSMGLGGWEGQWGAEEKGGWRATAMSANKQHSASAEAGWVASGGASGGFGLDSKKGAYAQGGVGGKVGAYAQGDADTKTGSVKIGGVDYDAGAGVHGEVFAGAKAGASGQIGLGPDFIGAKGDIGAFAGAEAAGDVHANLGPVGGKVGGSVMAGAGIGAEGDLSYKDGKFHVGGKLFAALGYGGSLSGDVTIDVGAIGRSAYSLGSDAVDAVGSAASTVGNAASDAVSAVLSW